MGGGFYLNIIIDFYLSYDDLIPVCGNKITCVCVQFIVSVDKPTSQR